MDITVSVHELHQRVLEMLEDGMDEVTLSVSMWEDDEPPVLMFEASSRETPFMGVEYDSIDSVASSN